MVRFVSVVAVFAIMAIVAVRSPSAGPAGEALMLPPHPDPLTIEADAGEVRYIIEIADDEEERARGLMFRTELEADRGMLFIFDQTARRGFWMKNTPLPLDMLFIAESGRVVAIRKGVPLSEEIVAPIYPVRFVLELNEGTAADAGIRIGARVRHPLVDAVSGAR